MDSNSPSDFGSHRQLQELPNELVEHILLDECIQIRDVCNVAKACKNLHFVCQSNELWKQKLKQRWPKLLSRYKRNQAYTWNQEVQKCYSVGKVVRQLLQELSPKFYKVEAISDDGFRDFDRLIYEFQSEEIVINQLMEVLHDERSHENLTNKYYCAKVIRYIIHSQLRKAWDNYLELPTGQQSPETGAVMIAQWCQPTVNITENDISDQFDRLAEETKCSCPDTIRNLYTKHKSDDKFPTFSSQQERVILETLNHVLYTKHEFAGNAGDYYDEKNSYIDQVLSRHVGIPITLSIVYNSVATRLGVHLNFVNFPGHFLLKWKEHPMAKMDQQYTFIDAFNNGRFLKRSELAGTFHLPDEILQSPDIFISTQPMQVFQRMCRNLINIGRQQGRRVLSLRNAVELSVLLNKDDVDTMVLQVRLYLHLNINLAEVREILQRIADLDNNHMGLVAYLTSSAESLMIEQESEQSQPIKQKIRNKNKGVAFSVGMVMQHKRYNYKCVIYGWDSSCQASQEWIEQMGVHNLPKKQHQPFYNVLVEDESNRYAAQENLYLPEESIAITHPEVGKYFKEFTGTYYIANDEKLSEYPDDFDVTKQLTDKHFDGS